ncbi:cadherin repeat domain-containing protein, partial [bacterium]|nr:cadherin repeat domain-containing protein [bacterium]
MPSPRPDLALFLRCVAFLALSGISAGCEVAVESSTSNLSVSDFDSLAPPTNISLSSHSLNENNSAGATVGAFSTTDSDTTDRFTYSLVSGSGDADNASFTIAGSDLKIVGSANYETKSSYSIRIRSTDSGGYRFEKSFTISVVDQNDAPTNLSLSSSSIAENESAGSTIGTLSSTDADPTDSFTYSLAAGTGAADNASFTIIGSALKLAVSANYESKSTYSVRIRSTDSGGLYFEKAFTIAITGVSEPPTNITLSSSSIAEGLPQGTIIGTLSATDPESASGVVYSLVSGSGDEDNSSFAISGSSLKVQVPINYDLKSQYSVRIRATDSSGLYFEKSSSLAVTSMCSGSSTPLGSGSASNPFRICTRSQLAQLLQSTGKYFVLIRNL